LPRRKENLRVALEVIKVSRDVMVSLAQSHPVVMALAVMSVVAAASLVAQGEEAKAILGGLYADAKTLATLSAAAPYVVGGLNLVSGVLSRGTT